MMVGVEKSNELASHVVESRIDVLGLRDRAVHAQRLKPGIPIGDLA